MTKHFLNNKKIYNNISNISKLKYKIQQSLKKSIINNSPNKLSLLHIYISLKPYL